MKNIILVLLAAACTASAQITNVNIGSAANAGDGDTLRQAFNKLNANDNYLNGKVGAGGTNNNYAANEPATNAIATTDANGKHVMVTNIPPLIVSTNGSTAGQVLMSRGGSTIWTNPPYQLLWVYTNISTHLQNDNPILLDTATNGIGTNVISAASPPGTVYMLEGVAFIHLEADAGAYFFFATNGVHCGDIEDFGSGTSSSWGNPCFFHVQLIATGGNHWAWSTMLNNSLDGLYATASGTITMTSDFKLNLLLLFPTPDSEFGANRIWMTRLSAPVLP